MKLLLVMDFNLEINVKLLSKSSDLDLRLWCAVNVMLELMHHHGFKVG